MKDPFVCIEDITFSPRPRRVLIRRDWIAAIEETAHPKQLAIQTRSGVRYFVSTSFSETLRQIAGEEE